MFVFITMYYTSNVRSETQINQHIYIYIYIYIHIHIQRERER